MAGHVHADEDHPPDPLSSLVGLDANALDRKGSRDEAVERFLSFVRSGMLKCRVGPGVAAEVLHTPGAEALREVARLSGDDQRRYRPLTAAQHIARIQVRAILRGNAQPGRHEADAVHLSQAAEAGCRFFITHDGRLLRKREDLQSIAVPQVRIVALEEFLQLVDGSKP